MAVILNLSFCLQFSLSDFHYFIFQINYSLIYSFIFIAFSSAFILAIEFSNFNWLFFIVSNSL